MLALEPGTSSMSSDGGFSYTARLTLSRPAESVMVRLKILNPSGKLMIQQTRIENQADTGTVVASFERDMSDLRLAPGAYPMQFEVRVSQDGEIAEKTVETELLVYDSARARLPFALCARVSGQPLTDPQGRFVADPARYTRARDDVTAIAAWVTTEPEARITLAVSPLLLDEWTRIATGYDLVGPEGSTSFPADGPTATSYAATIRLLKQAVETGRLELTTHGYADPDLSALATHGMIQDVDAHYAKGFSVTQSAVETTPSTGTVPAGGCLPPEAGSTLARHGVGYVVVEQSCAVFAGSAAAPGVYRADGPPLRILVTDDKLAMGIAAGKESDQIRQAFDRASAAGARGPLVVSCDIGPGGASTQSVFEAAHALGQQPWLRNTLARDIAARKPSSTVRLMNGEEEAPPPAGYWADVKAARAWARALAAATGERGDAAHTADDDSLIAQCSAWAGDHGQWELADRGRTFADTARRTARDVLSVVSLSVEPMTLAGSSGEVPVIITNGGNTPLLVDIVSSPSREIRIDGERSLRMELSPQDNFVKLPVTMSDAFSGMLRVSVSSAGVVLDRKTIEVRASYLDRLVLIASVIIVLGIMLAFIIRRVSAAETDRDDGE
jgi:hypothetical protein